MIRLASACQKCLGFSLIELFVALAVMAIVLSISLPPLAAMMHDMRVSKATNALHGAIVFTRAEAVRRAARVTLCTSRDRLSCANDAGWHVGWIVFVDGNGNAQREADEPLLRVGVGSGDGVAMSGNAPVARYLSYTNTGSAHLVSGALQFGTITVCARSQGRRIIISAAGRARVERVSAC